MSNIHFPSGQRPVYQQLSALTNDYFKAADISKTGDKTLHNKALVILAMYTFSYSALYWLPGNWVIAAWLLHGVATALVGFNIMHDGAHDSFSSSRKLNRLMALTFNLIGSNRFYWAQKHNRNHHAFTNVDESDEDIDALGLFRMSPHQQRLPFHRFQHIYVWFLYLITTLFWFFALDFKAYKSQKIAKRAYSQPMSFGDHAEFWVSKAVYLCIYLVLPALVMTTEQLIWGFLIMHAALGFLFAVVFQLAHVVDKAEFPRPDENGVLQDEWAVHQMRTTVDFATNNRFLTWALGGLNFQAEHHLFPRISHVHYPAIHPLIDKKAKELGYELRSYPTLWAALAGHYCHLRYLGRYDSTEASSQSDPQTC